MLSSTVGESYISIWVASFGDKWATWKKRNWKSNIAHSSGHMGSNKLHPYNVYGHCSVLLQSAIIIRSYAA